MSIEAAAEEIELGDSHAESLRSLSVAQKRDDQAAATNFGLMALYQIVMRTGWIFKTESIIMPAVLDMIGGPGWLRGCLPMLNRFGQSIPPVLASRRVHSARQKKFVLSFCTLLMGLTFWGLAAIWWTTGASAVGGQAPSWMPFAFLVLYALFFICTGINQLTLGTLIGKLIPVVRRGRLMLIASTTGTATAVLGAGLLLPNWLQQSTGNFFAIFAVTGTLFLVAAAISLFLVETSDDFPRVRGSTGSLFRAAAQTLAGDANLRRLAVIGSLFGMSLTLFPHYQALGRQRLALGLDSLLPWVITQNLGVALFSIPTGWLADRFGNRLVLRMLLAVVCAVPLVALAMSRVDQLGGQLSSTSFSLVFFLIGATPVTIRVLTSYCLELAPRAEQPRYLSTLSLCTAGPAIVTAPFLGGLIDAIGFEPIFLLVTLFLFVGWLLTLRMIEPRWALP